MSPASTHWLEKGFSLLLRRKVWRNIGASIIKIGLVWRSVVSHIKMKGLEGKRDASDIYLERVSMRLVDAGHAVAK